MENLPSVQEIMAWIGTVLVIARIIVAATPTPKDDQWLGKIYKVIELIALEVGKSKQHGTPTEPLGLNDAPTGKKPGT